MVVTLYLSDVNDNAPILTLPDGPIVLSEDLVADLGEPDEGGDVVVAMLVASDKDSTSDQFGQDSLVFRLDTPLPGLSLDETSGELKMRVEESGFDFEAQSEYEVHVTVMDMGGVGDGSNAVLSDSGTVTFQITNANDEPPVFDALGVVVR